MSSFILVKTINDVGKINNRKEDEDRAAQLPPLMVWSYLILFKKLEEDTEHSVEKHSTQKMTSSED